MGDVLKLNRARKRRARDEEAARAEANRQKHGRTGAEKRAARRSKADLDRTLDGARREGKDPGAAAFDDATPVDNEQGETPG